MNTDNIEENQLLDYKSKIKSIFTQLDEDEQEQYAKHIYIYLYELLKD